MTGNLQLGKDVGFERIRRITGYLVGTMDKWNDAKRAEESDRVKHVALQPAAMIDVAGLLEDSIVDGPGIRTVVFCQGCPHHCQGCHNPETWPFGIGTPMDAEKIYRRICANPLVRGVTFSGGEPFCQSEGFYELACLLRRDGYEVASYTGYTIEKLMEGTPEQKKLLSALNILIDGRYEQEKEACIWLSGAVRTSECWMFPKVWQRDMLLRRIKKDGMENMMFKNIGTID